jgi:hypothetical protein
MERTIQTGFNWTDSNRFSDTHTKYFYTKSAWVFDVAFSGQCAAQDEKTNK